MKDTRVINFYGGPSSGKSTAAAGLFYKMKVAGLSVELTDEFAKECVWEGNVPMLKDQLWVLAHQHRKILRLKGQVDFVITDSPVLLSPIYRELYEGPLYSDLIDKMALECYNMYDNINFMLTRPSGFEENGRAQNEQQSLDIDNAIFDQFNFLNIGYTLLGTRAMDTASEAYECLISDIKKNAH